MKLQTKLTLLFAGLLVVVAGILLLGLHLVSDIVAQNTAKSTLENVTANFASNIEYENSRLKDSKVRNYIDGAYLLVFSADGTELLSGMDVFGISGLMPALLQDHEAEQEFRIDTEEAGVYCYYLWKTEDTDGRGRDGKTGISEKNQDNEENKDDKKSGGKTDNQGKNQDIRETILQETDSEETEKEQEQEKSSDETAQAHALDDGSEDIDAAGVWVIGVLPQDSMENVMASVVRMAWIGLPVIVLLAALGGWIIAGRSLRRLRRITESAREISDGNDLSRRIMFSSGRDEVHELADTFNDMMGRLENSFEAERQFTSDASHELRTPTAVILAECEMAQKTPDDVQAMQESISEIQKQARKMSEIIGKLLNYTRLEQGTQRIDRETLDLSELAREVCEEQIAVNTRGIEILCDTEQSVAVCGDAALLISLTQNLVSNAVKYGKENGHVYVSVYKKDQLAYLSVRDDGIGISKEDLDRIWNRFYQTDHSRSNEERGVGLGLSLVQQIARLHGGTVSVSSTPGEGSEFIFSMPAI